jgi:hypothetical protein
MRQPIRLFALDQNFPEPIVAALGQNMPEAELVPLRRIDARLPSVEDDWRILHFLSRHHRPWHGLVTTDAAMISQPRELAMLLQTRLTLVVATRAGNDPVRASGLVLAYLPGICRRLREDVAEMWVLNAVSRAPDDPWEHLQRVAERQRSTATDLFAASRLPDKEFLVPADQVLA